MSSRARTAVSLLLPVLVAAGCGGGGGGASSGASAWASDVCTAVTDLRAAVAQAELTVTSGPARETIVDAAGGLATGVDAFVETVQGLEAPETASGGAAQEAVESFAAELETGFEKIEGAASDAGSGRIEVFDAIAQLRAVYRDLEGALSSTLDELQRLSEADDELQQGFAGAKECEGLVPPVS